MNYVLKQVLELLGTPPNYHDHRCVNVFGNNWRVNIFLVEKNERDIYNKTWIGHSYMVVTDDKGKIISSQPPIEKVYQ